MVHTYQSTSKQMLINMGVRQGSDQEARPGQGSTQEAVGSLSGPRLVSAEVQSSKSLILGLNEGASAGATQALSGAQRRTGWALAPQASQLANFTVEPMPHSGGNVVQSVPWAAPVRRPLGPLRPGKPYVGCQSVPRP